jgi:hypothetical protein
LKLGAGATESTKFLVESSGDTFIASGADLFIGGIGLNDNSSTSSGASLIGLYDDNMTYISGNTNVQNAIKQLDTAIGSVSGSAGGWTDDGTIVRLTTSSDRVGIGTTSVNANTKVGILGNLAIGSQTYSDAQAPTNGLIVEGNVGIGTTAPGAKLDVAGNILVNNGGSIDTRAAGTLTIGGTTQTGLTLGRSGATTSIVGSNITAGGIAYGASNTLTFTSAGTSGQPLLSGGSGAPTFGTLGLVYGGTNADLSGVAQGGLIYKGASALSGTGALSGILQGNGSSAPTAITGTANYVPRWSSSAPYLTSTSTIFDNGTNVGIGSTNPVQKLHVLGSCVTGDTLLPIRRRKKKSNSSKNDEEEFIWEYLLERIDKVIPGDEVLSLNEETGEFEYAKIKNLMDMGVQEIYEITTKSGKKIKTTGEHPYLTLMN